MKGVPNKKGFDLQKPIPACVERIVNLFDLSTGTKLLTEKPHRDGYPLHRSFSDDVSVPNDEIAVQRGEKQRKGGMLSGTPIKMLIEEEMWREEETETNQTPPSVVARLMGLNEFPGDDAPTRRIENSRKNDNNSHEKKMDLVRQKFTEAKHMATNEKLFHSKEFQDALQFLSSNRDLFVKFLEEPSSLFSSSNNNVTPPSPEIKQITVLKPSSESIKKSPKEHGNREIDISLTKPTHPTRIVVLKPSLEKTLGTSRSIFENISFCKPESVNLDDDLEVYTPSSGRSWDFNNCRIESPPSISSSSKDAYQLKESRVVREAKKRLVERWEMVSSKEEEEKVGGTTGTVVSTLGEMLTIHEAKREEEEEKKQSGNHVLLHRSKSLPVCSKSGMETGTEAGTSSKELEKSKSGKFKWRLLPSLFFSKSNKRPVNYGGDINRYDTGIENEGGSCTSSCHDSQENNCDISTKEVSCIDKIGTGTGTGTIEQQPSPVSVLETSFVSEFADNPSNLSDISASVPPQALSRSPPIGTVSRSLSWDNSQFEVPSPNSLRLSRFFSKADEEQYNFTYIRKLVAFSKLEEGKPWYSSDVPLNPSLLYEISGCKFDGSKLKDKLLFDSVNEALVEIGNSTELGFYPWFRVSNLDAKEPKNEIDASLFHEIWGVVRNWCMTFENYSPGGFKCGDLEVDFVAKKEVSGAKLEKDLLVEIFEFNKEMCDSIIGEVVEELIIELF